MTIKREVRELNSRLSNLEHCAQMAPEGTYERAKQAAEVIDEVSNGLLHALRARGFKVLNDDRLRNIEAAIYGYLLEANPDESGLIVAEGFGQHVTGPQGDRILADAIRNRDFLASARQ